MKNCIAAGKGMGIKKAGAVLVILFQVCMFLPVQAEPITRDGKNNGIEAPSSLEMQDSEVQEDTKSGNDSENNNASESRKDSVHSGFSDVLRKIDEVREVIKSTIERVIAEAEDSKKPKRVWSFNATYSIRWGDKSKEEIALTFDDGLDSTSVKRVLASLKKYEVKSTFFVTGKAVRQHPELWKQAVKDGHQICNHTETHALLGGLSDAQVTKEIKNWEKSVEGVLGKEYLEQMKEDFPFIRLPGGSGENSKRVMKLIADARYIPVGWSVETIHSVTRQYDKKKSSVDTIAKGVANHVVGSAQKGAIVLLHFNPYDTTRLDYIVKTLKDRGKAMKTVSEILEVK